MKNLRSTMMRLLPRLLTVATAFALLACGDDPTQPGQGQQTTVEIRAFVDVDGSGTFNEGDVPLAGVPIRLVRDGTALDATTDAAGVATFQVLTGSYVAEFPGPHPDGALLASAPTPVVVAPFQGGTVSADFRFVYTATTLVGVIFRDDNESGDYEPETDTPAPNVMVTLYDDPEAEALSWDMTDEDGRFLFAGLRPGTYWIAIDPPRGVEIVGGLMHQVTVEPGVGGVAMIYFIGDIVTTIAIAEARQAALNSVVTVAGVVTVPHDAMRVQKNNFWVQDGSGGIQVFAQDSLAAQFVEIGDSVQVQGTLSQFSGEIQIGGTVTVTILGTGTPHLPRLLSGQEIHARTYEGSLVRTFLVRVLSVGSVSGTTGSYNVNVRAADGTDFQVRIQGATVGIPASFWTVGNYYNVTGPQGVNIFSGTTTRQIYPRFPADAEAEQPIATARQVPTGTRVVVRGVVTVPHDAMRVQKNNFWVQDATGGIQVFAADSLQAAFVELGDSVVVTGVRSAFSGEIQLAAPVQVLHLGDGTVPAPHDLTGAEIVSRIYEGSLVRVDSLEVLSVGSVSSMTGSYNVNMRALDGSTFQIRIQGTPVGIPASFWTVGNYYRVTGVQGVNIFNNVTTQQIYPRFPSDAEAL
jgi:uncharacterized protein YdeI (BOF family)